MADETKKKQNNIALTVIIVAGIVLIAAALSAATIVMLNNNSQDKKIFTASYLASEVVRKMNYENLSELSPSDIPNYYEIPEGTITDSAMFISSRPDSYTEIACFKLNGKDKEKALTETIGKYISAKKKNYQNVNEKAYEVVSAGKTDVHYPYVFVAISSDSEAAISTFEAIVSTEEQS